jgi:uncharacterized protein (DUF58 family)
MKFSRCSRGIVALAIVLALFALFFDSIPAAIASGGLTIFLLIRGLIFLSALSSCAASLRIRRSLSALLVRQGNTVTVKTEVKGFVPPGFSVTISDLLPHGGVLSSGTATVQITRAKTDLNYTITLLASGEYPFGGTGIILADLFFSIELNCRTPETRAPSLVVLPLTEYARVGRGSYGEEDAIRVTARQIPEVRSFRGYRPGDDPRSIDWKLSAKHDTLYVREYMGQREHPTLLVVDLPDAALPFSPDAFARVREAAARMIASEVSSGTDFSVLIISGPNLVSYTRLEPDIRRLVAMIHQLDPVTRLYHMHRYQSTMSLKHRYSPLKGSVNRFPRTLGRITTAFLSERPPTRFESELIRIFHAISGSTAHLFTLDTPEASHIRIITELASTQAIHLTLHLPDEGGNPGVRERVSQGLVAPVEVL